MGRTLFPKNMIVADRRKLLKREQFPPWCFRFRQILQRQKKKIVSIALSTNDDILILDPESEFGFLVESTWRGNYSDFAASNTT